MVGWLGDRAVSDSVQWVMHDDRENGEAVRYINLGEIERGKKKDIDFHCGMLFVAFLLDSTRLVSRFETTYQTKPEQK